MSSSAVSDARPRDRAPAGTFPRDRRIATAAAVAASLIALGAAGGGSSAGSWPWATAGFALLAASTFVLEGVRWIPRKARLFGGALLALSVWAGLSAFWSIDSSASLRELERDALYMAAFASALGLLRFGGKTAVAAGIALGATGVAGYSLVDFIAGRGRTAFDWSVPAAPIGYANALAALSVLGAIAALSLAAAAGTARIRLAWLSLLAVLCPTIVLTRSLGAMVAGAAAVTTALILWARPFVRREVVAACVLVAAAVIAAGAVVGRSDLSRNDRVAYWRVAAKDFESHIAVGSGAGTYGAYWRRHPQRAYFTPFHAHSLYLETGAELGVVGLALLLAMLALSLSSIGTRDPIRLGAACGFLAFVLHAGIDWDWDVPVVTAAVLFFASVLVGAGRAPPP
ncbi:MAG TPA: O-antigen ligase family protein [Gaiellaceae bacterium]